MLKEMIVSFELNYLKQWEGLPANYKSKMAKGIVTFEMEVTDLQFKEKLSQNKQNDEQARIAASLKETNNSGEQWLGNRMEQFIKK